MSDGRLTEPANSGSWLGQETLLPLAFVALRWFMLRLASSLFFFPCFSRLGIGIASVEYGVGACGGDAKAVG